MKKYLLYALIFPFWDGWVFTNAQVTGSVWMRWSRLARCIHR